MHEGHYVFAQVMQHLPLTTFRRCVARYRGEHRIKRFTCLDQFLCLAFAQLTFRESLRDIEACLRPWRASSITWVFAVRSRDLRWPTPMRRTTGASTPTSLKSDHIARPLCADSLGFDLDNTVYALDSTTIDLCLSLFPWAKFRHESRR